VQTRPLSSNPNTHEVVIRGIDNTRTFIDTVLGTPLLLLAVSVNNRDDALVHLQFDATGMDQTVLEGVNATPIDAPYVKPGFTPITFVTADLDTKVYLVATDDTAVNNKNFGDFAEMVRDATFGNGYTVDDKHVDDLTTNVLIGATDRDRVLFAKIDGDWVRVNDLKRGPIDFAIQGAVVAYALRGNRKVVGTTYKQIADLIAGKQQNAGWRKIGDLPGALAYFGRGGKDGLIANLVGQHGIDYVAIEFKVDGTDIELQMKGNKATSTQDQPFTTLLVGFTPLGKGGELVLAGIDVDGDPTAMDGGYLQFRTMLGAPEQVWNLARGLQPQTASATPA
jgi:hypothetical protein